jgi:dTDP-4-amino-4,6-dideoxygalactose transaminase
MIWRCDLIPQYEAFREEIDSAILRVLNSGRYILASEVDAFEKEFAAYLGVRHAVGVANGTDGLTLALRALEIGPGDEVITTPFTAIPTAAAIIDTGATPVFVDIGADTFLIDIDKVSSAITKRTKAIVPVHIFGNVLDVNRLRQVVGSRIAIVEDACQSHGATIDGIESGTMGEMGVFSFYPTKNLGGYGDGGAVVTNDEKLAQRVRLLRMYGMTDYNHIIVNGINSRLDELQAAVLRVKLKYLDEMNHRRNDIANRYRTELRTDMFKHQQIPTGVRSNYHVFASRCTVDRDELSAHLTRSRIQTNVYYLLPLHLQQALAFLGGMRGDLPVAECLCNEVIALPMYAEMRQEVLNIVIETVNQFEVAR